MNTSRCRATCGYRAAAVSKRSRVMVNTASPSGVGGNVSGEAWLFLMWTRMTSFPVTWRSSSCLGGAAVLDGGPHRPPGNHWRLRSGELAMKNRNGGGCCRAT